LWHEDDFLFHQFVARLHRVHPANKDIMMEIGNFGKVLVKAAYPLAKPEFITLTANKPVQRYFLPLLGHCHDSTLCNFCPWMAITCKKSLDRLFTL
jgi:hypothetical protein